MQDMVEISFEEFVGQYKPEINKFEPDASFDGYMFETFGEELEYVQEKAKVGHVWTLVEDEGMSIVYGYHFVNRLGYFVTEHIPRFEDILVKIDDLEEEKEQKKCPYCDCVMRGVILDTDGTNLENGLECPECGYTELL